jgi:hypothetical protein
MIYLNNISTYSFIYNSAQCTVAYYCVKEDLNLFCPATDIWLVIELGTTILKIKKPELILKQPTIIVEKIVEREVKQYLDAEQVHAT